MRRAKSASASSSPSNTEPIYYRLRDAARVVGLSRWTLMRAVQRNQLVAYYPHGPSLVLFKREDLIRFVERNSSNVGAE